MCDVTIFLQQLKELGIKLLISTGFAKVSFGYSIEEWKVACRVLFSCCFTKARQRCTNLVLERSFTYSSSSRYGAELKEASRTTLIAGVAEAHRRGKAAKTRIAPASLQGSGDILMLRRRSMCQNYQCRRSKFRMSDRSSNLILERWWLRAAGTRLPGVVAGIKA